MKTIKSKSLDENRVAWTGYDLGALLSSRVQSVTVTRSGDTVATLADGMLVHQRTGSTPHACMRRDQAAARAIAQCQVLGRHSQLRPK